MIDARLESLGLQVTLGLAEQSLRSVLEMNKTTDSHQKYRLHTVTSEKPHGMAGDVL